MDKFPLTTSVKVLMLIILIVVVLYYGKPFLIPLTFAGLFSFLLLPLSKTLEKNGFGKGWAALCCLLVIVAAVAAIASLLGWQVSSLAQDANQMEQRIMKMVDQLRQSLSNTFGISPEKQQQMLQKQQQGGSGGMGQAVTGIMSSISGLFVDSILVLVYIFLMLVFRSHIRNFILQLVPAGQKPQATKVISQTGKVTQNYLGGLAMMIMLLWVMYGIAFSIIGVKNAIFFAILCGLLEIVPFVGNLLGNAITILMAITQGGGSSMIIAILITYALVQFIQSYILEPLVVGAEVNINPLFTIIAIVAGELLWGVPGMILGIPLMGIAKIICDNVEGLKPYGFLIGKEKKKKNSRFSDRLQSLFRR